MLRTSRILFSLFLFMAGSGLCADDYHLKPEYGIFSNVALGDYYLFDLARALLLETPISSFIGMVAMPSRRSEWAVSVMPHDSDMEVNYIVLDQQMWARLHLAKDKIRHSSEVSIYSSRISNETGLALKSLWKAMLCSVQYPREQSGGVDGTTYIFYSSNDDTYGAMSGRTWSPTEGSYVSRLVSIGNMLKKFALSDDKVEQKKAEYQLMHDAVEFIQSYKKEGHMRLECVQ